MTADQLVALRREHGSLRKASRATGISKTKLQQLWNDAGLPAIGKDGLTAEEREQASARSSVEFNGRDEAVLTEKTALGEDLTLGDVDELLRARGLDPDEWDVVSLTVNEWEGPKSRDEGGGLRKYRQLKAHLRRKTPLDFLFPATGEIPPLPAPEARLDYSRRLVVVTSCAQAPYNDPAFESAFRAFLTDIEPHEAVDLGDLVDFSTISRHRDNPAFFASAQECVNAGYEILRYRREASPATAWTLMEGNHDFRLRGEILARAERTYGLRPADVPGESPEEDALSLRRLLRLEALGVEYVQTANGGQYQHGEKLLSPKLVARHGWIAKNAASTSLRKLGISVVVGHSHRQAIHRETTYRGPERVTLTGVEVGCFARIDGGLGYAVAPDWQNGFATFEIDEDGSFTVDLATFDDGVLRWRGDRWRP